VTPTAKSVSLCLMAAAVVTAGCATREPPIAVSLAPDAARVRFVNKVNGGWIDLYPETECNRGINVIHDLALANAVKSMTEGAPRREQMLDPPAADDRNVVEYSFRPGQVINVGIGGNPGSKCLGGLSFQAAPSTQYEIEATQLTPTRCSLHVSVLERNEDGVAVRRRPLYDVRPLVCKKVY
jgi:hypothetical protein